MKKETFVKIVEGLQEQYQKENRVGEVFEKEFGEYFLISNTLFTTITDALSLEFNDNFDTIGWWLWDVNGVTGEAVKLGALRDADGEPIDVSTPDKLYDYLTEL